MYINFVLLHDSSQFQDISRTNWIVYSDKITANNHKPNQRRSQGSLLARGENLGTRLKKNTAEKLNREGAGDGYS